MCRRHAAITVECVDTDSFRVQIGDETRTGDLYYLGMDPRTADFECSAHEGLGRLIDAWIRTILSQPTGDIFHLPFDFADEFTRWIACEKRDDNLVCVFGWAPIEGWAISPSAFDETYGGQIGFRPDEPVVSHTFYLPRVLSDLRRCRAIVRASFL